MSTYFVGIDISKYKHDFARWLMTVEYKHHPKGFYYASMRLFWKNKIDGAADKEVCHTNMCLFCKSK